MELSCRKAKRTYRCRSEKLNHYCASPLAKIGIVRTYLSSVDIHFLKRMSFCEINGYTMARTCSNRLGDIWQYLKIRDEEYLICLT